ncbi:MAG: mercury resistance system periplasmic binding protein MerP [Hydrogenophaga sp.]|jgi:mercuric ion binding protein|uniref:mercury resistance system periplasmic binding protein MerP n=1 Tax=Hydrogenophaga sp. TaxID=1904254 RepID=UPI00271F61DE|nr:mercury resistance system periplasmic binding protein MerP [Hydrogenophaga sp.]MDO9135207.1 mercury resistance system periplasmic binding protein MerP [Hydrogenophaga sp.]MDO9506029.1 mercury resistance system periplasmic binding protein MerP [Hydrogenophaga sp.]MDP1782809.1 mercury resistance system periplasmic binding protein MerP [Hydrogenophaga sp.]MDP2249744.1 mercury resistance system periplasmic binding protein MerP [Hydrogenophaga sp.]MDP3205506.1 mercury resistance system periplasm
MKGLPVKHILIAAGFVLSPLAWAAQQTATLSVPGMTCATCPITVKKALTQLGGVIGVKSNLDKREVTVVYDDARVSLENLTQATRDAGFPSTVSGVKP